MPQIHKMNQMNLQGHWDQGLSFHLASIHIIELYNRTWINRHALNGLLLTCRYWFSWYRSSKGTIPTELTTDVDGLKHTIEPVSPNVTYWELSDYENQIISWNHTCYVGWEFKRTGQLGSSSKRIFKMHINHSTDLECETHSQLFFTLLTVLQIHNLEVSPC